MTIPPMTIQFDVIPRATLELVTGMKLKTCRLCGVAILEPRHRRDVSIAHLDADHPGWRAR